MKERLWILKHIIRRLSLLLAIAVVISIFCVPTVSAFVDLKIGNFIRGLYAPSSNITITAVPAWGSMPPMNFQVNQVAGEVICTWENPPTSVATMVRAKHGSPVLSITDGYEVYFGAGVTATDLGVNLDDNISDIYYTAWAFNIGDIPSDPVSDIFEVSKMALIIVTAALVGLAFWQRSNYLMILAGVVAIGFGSYWIAEYDGFIYVLEGVVVIGIGCYLLINTGVELLRGR